MPNLPALFDESFKLAVEGLALDAMRTWNTGGKEVFDDLSAKYGIGRTSGNEIFWDDEPVHSAFGLTYANYFVVPRLVLQSMPAGWQRRFVAMIKELHETIDDDWPDDYEVFLRDKKTGRFISDPYSDYERGRRRLKLRGTG